MVQTQTHQPSLLGPLSFQSDLEAQAKDSIFQIQIQNAWRKAAYEEHVNPSAWLVVMWRLNAAHDAIASFSTASSVAGLLDELHDLFMLAEQRSREPVTVRK